MTHTRALLLAPMGSVHRRFNEVNIRSLQQIGYEVHLLANFENGEGPEGQNSQYLEKCKSEGVVTHSLPFRRHSLTGNLPLIRQVSALIQEGNFGIVHANTETGGLILRLTGHRTGTKYIFTPHGMSFYHGSSLRSQLIYRPLEKWISRGMDINIAINQEEYQVFQKWNNKTAHFVHGIGLDIERYSLTSCDRKALQTAIGIPQDAFVLMSVGELDENKNHNTVLRAISDLDNPSIHYIVCGVGPQKSILLQDARTLGIEHQIHLLGYRRDIPELLHAADIYVFPSFHEGLPVALMEAMAAGLPVIASNIRGNRDLLQDTQPECLFEPDCCQALSKKIQFLFENQTVRQQMGKQNFNTVQAFSKSNVKNELLELYSQK